MRLQGDNFKEALKTGELNVIEKNNGDRLVNIY